MKNTKTELKFFSVPEWKKEEQYLREQHQKGWAFTKVTGVGLYHFQKCKPQDVVYQLDYNPDSAAQKDEYLQMFRDCGWEYLQNYVGYSYFRKPAGEMAGTAEEIFCDDASRLDMMNRVFKGRMIPLLVIFFLIIVPQIINQGLNRTPSSRVLMITFCVLFVLYLLIFVSFAVPYLKYYSSVHKG